MDDRNAHWRKRLDEHTSPLDLPALWQTLEPQLPTPHRKRRALAWWPLLGLLLLGTAALVVWYPQEKGMPAEGPGQDIPGWPQGGAEKVADREDGPLERSSEQLGPVTRAEIGPAVVALAVQRPHSGGSVTYSRSAQSAAPSEEAAQLWPEREGLPAHEATAREDGGIIAPHQPPADPGAAPSAPRPGENALPVQELALDARVQVAAEEEIGEELPQIDANASPRKNPTRKKWTGELSLLGGLGGSTRQFTATEEQSRAYVQQRRQQEQGLEAITWGLDVRLVAPSGFFFQTGLRRQILQERYTYASRQHILAWEWATGEILDGSGQPQTWSDSVWVSYQWERTVRHTNLLRTWDIPLALGYRWQRSRWEWAPSLGLVLNIRQQSEGRSSDTNGHPAYWGEVPELTYASRLGLGGMAQLRIARELSPRWGAFLQPVYYFQPANRMDNAAGYTLRHHSVYLQAGAFLRLK